MRQLIAILLLAYSITASAQTSLKISAISGEEFSCLMREVASVRLRDDWADIVSRNGECLFSFQLFTRKRQTIVFCNEVSELPDNPDVPGLPDDPENPELPDDTDTETAYDSFPYWYEKIIEVFPNPTSDIVMIRDAGDNPEVRVISLSGAVIITTNGNELDLRNLPKGTYIITVNNQAFKIIKE